MARKKLYKLKGAIYTAGYEIKDFAQELGIHKRTLSGIICGSTPCSDDLKGRIADKLGCRQEYLFEL